MIYVDYSVMVFVGATTEMETLKKALAEAQEKAAKEQVTREKHEAQVDEVQLELQDAVKNASPWSAILQIKRLNSPRPSRALKTPMPRPRGSSRRSRRPRRLQRVRHLLCKASM